MKDFVFVSEKVLTDALIDILDELKIKHKELGMEASGDWLRALEVQTRPNSGLIIGANYTEWLSKGRKAGGKPPISNIERWVKVKIGLSGTEARSMAFAVANKIAKEGTSWNKKGGSDLLQPLLDEENIKKFWKKVQINLQIDVKEKLLNQFQKSYANR